MKNLNNSKQIVFIIGFITFLVGMFFAISKGSLTTNFFILYVGLTLMGTVVLHKEQKTEMPNVK